jgi:chemotaxis protein MotB
MAKKDKCECPAGLPGWLATFGDLMSLLLTFFILLLSFSSIQETKFNEAMGSLQGALGVLSNNSNIDLPNLFNITKDQGAPNSDTQGEDTETGSVEVLLELENELSQTLNNIKSEEQSEKSNPEVEKFKEQERSRSEDFENATGDSNLELDLANKDYVDMKISENGVHIIINDSILFKPGEAKLKDSFKNILNAIGKVIAKNQSVYNVIVEGHTDNIPIRTARYPSNWELSQDRALSVVKQFMVNGEIDPTIFSATGYGEYRPVATNKSREGRAKNRRVEIYLERKSIRRTVGINKLGEE